MTKKRKSTIRLILIIVFSLFFFSGLLGFKYYNYLFKKNIKTNNSKSEYIFIPSNAKYADVLNILKDRNLLISESSFNWVANKKKYSKNIKSGRYLIKEGMSNNSLINMLRSGKQDPVMLTFNNVRKKSQLAGIISKQIEADSAKIMQLFADKKLMKTYGFESQNSILLFIPNTYEFYWNTSAEKLFERMYKEYNKFWTQERKQKSKKEGFSPIEIGILASIVQKETNKLDEMSRVAGVYINRLKRNIPLQADPTVIYALNDFSIKRVLEKHAKYNSPYNTYVNNGLPPGPICLPSIKTLLKTLNFEKHNYMFFCAKSDFSGYHAFARTLPQHNANARKYHNALNKRGIK